MNFKLKISHKLILAFGILLVAMLLNALLTTNLVRKNKAINDKYNRILEPSATLMESMLFMINNSKLLIKNWVHIDKIEGTPDKIALKNLHEKDYPFLKGKIARLQPYWSEENKKLYSEVSHSIDSLFVMHQSIMKMLNNFSQYNDAMTFFEATVLVEKDGDVIVLTDKIISKLSNLVVRQKMIVEQSNNEMLTSFDNLGKLIFYMTIFLGISVLIIAQLTTRSIVRPMVFIKNVTHKVAKGILPDKTLRESSDEVGEMAKALNILVAAFKKTSEFALHVGQGNFESEFTPMSEQDILGNSLITMRKNLKEATDQLKRNEEILEQKVIERTAEVVKQKEIIENKNKELTAGIRYAKRIQDAMLPKVKVLQEYIPDSFIFLKPRDIVSGDFYWFRVIADRFVVAAVDCTGHGVPGGFMSVMGISLLNEITRRQKINEASVVLDELRERIKKTMSQTGEKAEQKDGMDISLCTVDTRTNTLQYAGAYNSLLIVRKDENGILKLIEVKADKMPIGIYKGEEKSFTNHVVNLEKDDSVYMFSDGYMDQFGGPKGRKFLLGNFKELLLKINSESMQTQKEILELKMTEWINHTSAGKPYKQMDDILVMGFRIGQ